MVDNSLIVSADLSFRAPGVVALGCNKEFYYFRVPSPTPSLKRFGDMYNASWAMAKEVSQFISLTNNPEIARHYVFEEPPPRSIFSSGLYVLNTACLKQFRDASWECHSCSALLVKSALGSRNATKSDAIALVSRMLISLPPLKFTEVIGGKLKEVTKDMAINDMLRHDGLCEALIIMSAFLLNRGHDITGTFGKLTNGKKFNFQDLK